MIKFHKLVKSYVFICTKLPKNIVSKIISFISFIKSKEIFKKIYFSSIEHENPMDFVFDCAIVDKKKYLSGFKVIFKKTRLIEFETKGTHLFKFPYKKNIFRQLIHNFLNTEYTSNKVYLYEYPENINQFLKPFYEKDYKKYKNYQKKESIKRGFEKYGIISKCINIAKFNITLFKICNNIKNLFPNHIAGMIKKHIHYDYDYTYSGEVIGKILEIIPIIKKKFLIKILIQTNNRIYELLPEDYIFRIHNKKYMKLYIENMIFDNYYYENGNFVSVPLTEFYSPMEKFIYQVLKKTFKPRKKIHDKIFKISC